MHDCPKCKSATLVPLSAPRRRAPGGDPFIPPCRCSRCRGVWLPHEAVEAHHVPGSMEAAAQVPGDSDARSGICPLCRGVLVRARVEGDHSFYLDRCPICSGIWFDAGEWAAIAASEWLTHLDDLWDPVWRKRVRARRAEKRHLETLQHALGEEAFAKVVEVVRTLRAHPMRSLGLSFLIDELRGPGR
jgi:Zn-finger nucleic acid-binding protein